MTLYGLLGYPLGHSFSARYFADKFARLGLEARYVNFEYPTVESGLQALRQAEGLQGFNVTIPFKEQIIPWLDGLSDEAREIGAVNVVKVVRDAAGRPRFYGYNSDIIGFMRSFRPGFAPSPRHRALVLGTGGASKAVLTGLRRLGFRAQPVSRTARPGVWSYAQLDPCVLSDYPVWINCTPLGMYPQVGTLPDLPYGALTSSHYLYDLVYNPETTAFLRQGLQHGARVRNGLEMLHLQAEAAWQIWNETAPQPVL